MAFLRALVQIARDTTLPEDVITNTWHFDSDGGTAAAAAAEAMDDLRAFYLAIDALFVASLIQNTATVDWYDLEDDEPRAPVLTDTIVLVPSAGTALPPELSVCLSFQGAQESGANMRRRRGRLYLPPMDTSSLSLVGGRVTVAAPTVTTIVNAADAMLNMSSTLGLQWAVFSPTTLAETGSYDAAFEDVTNGWVDNEWDIQRRRGTVAQSRTLFS